MISVTIEIPESLNRTIEELASREGYTLEQFLASAAGEKCAVVLATNWLCREAALGRREDFDRSLAAVPAAPVSETDRVP